jgi:hypothetical protein
MIAVRILAAGVQTTGNIRGIAMPTGILCSGRGESHIVGFRRGLEQRLVVSAAKGGGFVFLP